MARTARTKATPHPRAARHRAKMRHSGMRLVQFWVPDIRRPEFAQECRRQSRLAAAAERKDGSLMEFLDKALSDLEPSE